MATIPTGPPVADHEDAIRAILAPEQWSAAESRPSSAAFDDDFFSVDIASLTTYVAVRARFRQIFKLVQFNCGLARLIEFYSHHEPDPQFPDNLAHAHVYFGQYELLGKKKRKAKARKLADLCRVV